MTAIARCNNSKCLLVNREGRYPTNQVPKCRLCGTAQQVVRHEPDPVVQRPQLPTWPGAQVGGTTPTVLQLAMYAPCTNPMGQWATVSAAAEIGNHTDVLGARRDTAESKVKLLEYKLGQAEARLPAAAGRTVQKVFVVPEWFFRKCIDVNDYYGGQYNETEMRAIVADLQAISRKPALRDWLIFAGSIRWQRPVTTAIRRYPNGESVALEIINCQNTFLELNTSVVVSGGNVIRCYYKKWNGGDTGGPATETVTVEKLKSAAVTRIFAAQESVRGGEMRTVLNQLVDFTWDFGVVIEPAVVSGGFTFKGLNMGVEICADADNQALRKDVGATLDLHVVVSCDLEDLAGNAEACGAVKDGRYLVQCDGNQVDFRHHRAKSFKVLRRDGDEYEAVDGNLHGDGIADSIFVAELPLA